MTLDQPPVEVQLEELRAKVTRLSRTLEELESQLVSRGVTGQSSLTSSASFLDFGQGVMRLDRNGIQMNSPSGVNPSLYFVDGLSEDPGSESYNSRLDGVILDGTSANGFIQSNASGSTGLLEVEASASSVSGTVRLSTTSAGGGANTATVEVTTTANYGVLYLDAGLVLERQTISVGGASVNDYDPTNNSRRSFYRLESTAAIDITGWVPKIDAGRILAVVNVGTSTITFKDASASSAAANRFALVADIALAPDEGATFIYDGASNLWRCIGRYP